MPSNAGAQMYPSTRNCDARLSRWRLDYTNFMQQGKRQEFRTRRNATDVRFIPSACPRALLRKAWSAISLGLSRWLLLESPSEKITEHALRHHSRLVSRPRRRDGGGTT